MGNFLNSLAAKKLIFPLDQKERNSCAYFMIFPNYFKHISGTLRTELKKKNTISNTTPDYEKVR